LLDPIAPRTPFSSPPLWGDRVGGDRVGGRPGRGLFIALAFAALCGCKPKSEAIPVGSYLSLSGVDSTFGTDTRDGIELALEQANAAGGAKGKKLEILYEDDKSSPQEVSTKVHQLIDRDGVVALLGEVASSRSMVGGLVANTSKVPMITPSSTAVEVTRDRAYVFRTCFTNTQQGDAAARYAHLDLKRNTAAILYVAQDNYSSGLAQTFHDSFTHLGGSVALEKGYQKGETNFTTYLSELEAQRPDILFVPVYYNDMVQIARQGKPLGITGPMLLGGDAWDSADLLEGAGAELEGAHFMDHYAPDVPWPNSQAFLGAFRAKFGHDPGSIAAQGYDAARLLFDAIGRAKTLSRDAIKNALAETKDFAGATGTMTIDADHNAIKPIVVVAIKGKSFTYEAQILAK
jgi:branched-chain amino acid transport system substrate-binding protein